jgi:hypothetical protein
MCIHTLTLLLSLYRHLTIFLSQPPHHPPTLPTLTAFPPQADPQPPQFPALLSRLVSLVTLLLPQPSLSSATLTPAPTLTPPTAPVPVPAVFHCVLLTPPPNTHYTTVFEMFRMRGWLNNAPFGASLAPREPWDAGFIEPSAMLRLANQNGAGCGRVEILYQGQWGTVCDDYWDNSDATVACRQLGRGFTSSSRTAIYGEGSGAIWLDNVGCSGMEESLENCVHNGWGIHDCRHREDAGACCSGSTGT